MPGGMPIARGGWLPRSISIGTTASVARSSLNVPIHPTHERLEASPPFLSSGYERGIAFRRGTDHNCLCIKANHGSRCARVLLLGR